MKILVIGSKGFIGSKYCEEIKKCGHDVIDFDLPENDILDMTQVTMNVNKSDMVVHFAAIADIRKSFEDVDKNFDVNIRGTHNIASACANLSKPMIFISTCCVYGNSLDGEVNEYKTNPQCNEPYSTSKVAGEQILKGMPYLKYMILRIGTVYGPGQREALFTHIVLDHVKNEKIIYIDGEGTQERQLVYIDDLIEGICLATVKFQYLENGRIFNICGYIHTSAIDCVRVAEKVTGKRATIQHRDQRYGQIFKENINTGDAFLNLGWIPKTDFYDGMKYTYENDERYG